MMMKDILLNPIVFIENLLQKAYFRIRNDQGEYDINLFCQQVSSLLNSFPMWNLQIKCEGKQITKILLIDP